MNFRIAVPAVCAALVLAAPAIANNVTGFSGTEASPSSTSPAMYPLPPLAEAEANGGGNYTSKAAPKMLPKQMDAQELTKMAKMLGDPRMQKDISKMVEGFAAAMMEMPVGKMAAAIEEARPGSIKKPVPANATVADLAGKDASNLPHEFGAQSKDMMGMMGGMLSAFAVMLPEFEKMGREIADKMPRKK